MEGWQKRANEKRLIDATELKNFFGFMRKMWSASEIIHVINEADTVDAVVLPCKVGDYVYYIKGGYYKEPRFCEVSRPCKIVEVSFKLKRDSGCVMYGFITDNGTRYSFNSIGKNVFLTKEEAEAALAKRRGDGNG